MSKIKFQGNASGTGVLTITSPNTNADRTITLPDEDVTLGGGVDGIVSSANATAMTITSAEKIGIGTGSPSVNVHIVDDASEGTPTFAGATHFAVQATASSSDNVNASLISGSAGVSRLMFGDKDDEDIGKIEYNNSTNAMSITTNTSTAMTITSDGRGLSQFTAKAWVNFVGHSTVSINDSHNVSSIQDNGTGNYSINFSNNMANTNYSVASMSQAYSQYGNYSDSFGTFNVAWFKVEHREGGSYTDVQKFCANVFGD